MGTGKVIEIVLPTGEPNGYKYAEVTTNKIKIIQSSKKEFAESSEIKKVYSFNGIYILVDSLQKDTPEIYIGKGWVKDRISQHIRKKQFWNILFGICLNTKNGFNDAHITYLENYFIQLSNDIGRSIMPENQNTPSDKKSNLTDSQKIELDNYVETIKLLLSTLGLKIFEPLYNKKNITTDQTMPNDIHYKTQDVNYKADGIYNENGFIILKGSLISKKETKTLQLTYKKKRQELLDSGTLKDATNNDKCYELQHDVICSSLSAAASITFGRSESGPRVWQKISK